MTGQLQSPARADWTRGTIVVGRVIVACTIVVTLILLVLIQRIARTYEDALIVAEESAQLAADSLAPITVLTADLGALAQAVADGLDDSRAVLATTQDTLASVGDATATNVADLADAAADVSDRLARQFEFLESLIPGDTQSIAEELRAFSDGLEPLADQLRTLGVQLQTGAAQLDATDTSIVQLADRIAVVSTDIDELVPTVDVLAVSAGDLTERAEAAAGRLATDKWLLRLLVIVGGLALASVGVAAERIAHAADRAPSPRGT